jgi:hypothetical protein
LYFGILPWQVYEPKKHYRRSYWLHLWLNIQQVTIWLTFRETESDVEFEKEVNTDWPFVLGKLFRWQAGAKKKHGLP